MERRTKIAHLVIQEDDYERILEAEIYSDNPNEKVIRECVANGANISGDYLYNIIWLDMKKPKRDNAENSVITIATVRLLIELGADVKWHEPYEADCLLPAVWTWMPDLVELLLVSGADPNGFQEGQSILDCAYDEKNYASHEGFNVDEEMGQIVELIKKYGGKLTKELKNSHETIQ